MSMLSLHRISSESEVLEVLERTYRQPVLLFKHSATCPISARAHREVEKFLSSYAPHTSGAAPNDNLPLASDSPLYAAMIVVQEARSASNLIAERTGVQHQSPQVLLLSGGTVLWSDSHSGITAERLQAACNVL
jgi:bacillithiol system protein YtxJ